MTGGPVERTAKGGAARRIGGVVRHVVFGNALVLSGFQLANYALPLLTVPFLARVLGTHAWGDVVVAQSLGFMLGMLIEYGFNLSATREIARSHLDKAKLTRIVADVMSAKLALIAATLLIGGVAALTMSGTPPSFVLLALGIAVSQGVSPSWYFQGTERLAVFAFVELGGKLFATAAIFITVRGATDAWNVLAWQAGFGLAACMINVGRLYGEVAFARPTRDGARDALKRGWGMFLFRAMVSLYTTANVLLLSFFVLPAQTALYGGAEKITKASQALLASGAQAAYPRVSSLVQADRTGAQRIARITGTIVVGLSVLICVVLVVCAPLVIRVLLGPSYEAAVTPLRILALLLPIISASNVLGIQWMLPLGMDRQFTRIVGAAGLLNLTFASLLAWQFGIIGMSWAVVVSELFVTLAMLFALISTGNAFWTQRTPQ